MKVGDKIYWLVCWEAYDCRYAIRTATITKINRKTIELWGRDFKFHKDDLGYEYFTSKKKMWKYYLKEYKDSIKPTLRAIKYFERKIKK